MQDQEKHCTVVYALIGKGQIVGYIALATCGVELSALPEASRKSVNRQHMQPGVLLGRLAVSQSEKGLGYGRFLVLFGLYQAVEIANRVGAAVVLVDAKGESIAGWYKELGFQSLPDNPLRLFMPMKTAREAISAWMA